MLVLILISCHVHFYLDLKMNISPKSQVILFSPLLSTTALKNALKKNSVKTVLCHDVKICFYTVCFSKS